MSPRRGLPSRRLTESFKFEHEGVRYHAGVGRFEDGSIAELFLKAGKPGSAVNTMARDAAVVFSLARQYDVPLDVIRASLSKLKDGTFAGPVGMALKIADEG